MDDNKAPRAVLIHREPIELSQLLKFAGLAESGGDAKLSITQGRVLLNGAVETQKGKKLKAGDLVSLGGETVIVQVGA